MECDDWNPESVSDVTGFLNVLKSISFISCFFVYVNIFVFNIFNEKSSSDVNLCKNEIRSVKEMFTALSQ